MFFDINSFRNAEMFGMDKSKFLNAEDGFLRGNIIEDEYEPYKNHTYFSITPKSEKDLLLFKVYEYDFAINDLNLYLDLHQDDKQALNLFNKYVHDFEMIKNEYVKRYGPLEVRDIDDNEFNWVTTTWPWGGSENV